MSKRCVCGAVMEDDMMFCTECGKKLEEPAPAAKGGACPRCGAAMEPGDVFCTSCGCDLRKGAAASEADRPAPEAAPARPRVIIGSMERPTGDTALDAHFHAPGDL